MSRFYLSIDSTYRNRNEYPYPSDFVALISQSGAKNALNALDPISDAAPLSLFFTPFLTINGTVVSYLVPPGPAGVVLSVLAGAASQVTDFYNGLTIQITDLGNATNYRPRISSWNYMYTAGGQDYFTITFTDSNFSIAALGAMVFTLTDPSVVSDPNRIVLFVPGTSLSIKNLYSGFYVFNQTQNEWLTIIAYDEQSHTIIASPRPGDLYTGAWLLTDVYSARRSIPIQYGNITGGGSTSSQIVIVNGSTNMIGSFIQLNAIPPAQGEFRRIVAFDAATNTATVAPAFTIPTAGIAYEILGFTRDNSSNIVFNFSEVSSSMAVCYKVVLLNISLPNIALKNAYGGRAIFYPYLFVSLESINSSEGKGPNMIASNNPNATRMLFRISINDSSNEIISPIIRLSGSGMVQHMKVRPTDSFRLSVYLPDGSPFLTELQDTVSPLPPNPLIQISALFYFERINSNSC